jgi:hypothetical protein
MIQRAFNTVLAALLCLLVTGGCAFGDRQVALTYQPVMSIKARAPLTVDVRPFQSARGMDDEKKIGQVRNGYGMVTAKVLSTSGDAPEWVRKALADELANAGFKVARPDAPTSSSGAVSVGGTLNEFMTDMSLGGYDTRIRATFTVARNGIKKLEKEFTVQDGGSGITGSPDEYHTVAKAALTKLMRKALPEIIAAIEN